MPTTLPYLYGNTPLDWTAAYGGRPTTAAPRLSFGNAISGNIGNLPSIYNMAGSINEWQQAQAGAQMEQALPGFGAAQAQDMRNIGSWSRGEVAPDVISQIMQGAAERGIGTGQGAFSPNANAAYLRALGLTSQGLQQQAGSALTAAVARAPRGGLLNISPWLVTGEQEQSAEQAANIYASMPNPAAAAAANEAALRRGITQGTGVTAPGRTNTWNPGGATAQQRWVTMAGHTWS